MVALAPTSGFAEGVMQLLQRVDYRRAVSPDDREAIFRLRHDAYRHEGTIPPSRTKRITDDFDDSANAWIFGVHIDGKLASSIRLNVTSAERPLLPALRVFPDLLAPEVAAGRTIVDPTRFVADRASSRAHPQLPYVTVRLAWLAAEFFNADLLLATVRREHQAFYQRVFGHRPVCEARPYPSLTKPISLMTCDYPARRDQVLRRYPFFRSAFFERRMLFERYAQAPQRSAA
jgi:N-acyl amino acid synthase FeeM